MRIEKIKIKGYKSLKDITFHMNRMMVLIGENNSGKSNILEALNYFFHAGKVSLSRDHFCAFGGDCQEIEITVTFTDLSDEEKRKFSDHLEDDTLQVRRRAYRESLEEGGDLEKFLAVTRKPMDPLLQKNKSDIDSEVLEELQKEYTLPDYTFGTRGPTVTNVKQNWYRLVEDLAGVKGYRPEFQESTILGYTAVAQGNLPKFLWLPAVQEAEDEVRTTQKSLFGQIFSEVLTEAVSADFANRVQNKLNEIAQDLNNRPASAEDPIRNLEKELESLLGEHVPETLIQLSFDVPTLEDIMTKLSSVKVDDGVAQGLEHKGHGMQRLFIFMLLRAFARRIESTTDEGKRDVILAIEEPEIYQHPPAQRRLFEILRKISNRWQVLHSTHSPNFFDISEYKDIALISRSGRTQPTTVFQERGEIFSGDERDEFKLVSKVDPTRGELFFSNKVILVEGDSERLCLPLIAEKIDVSLPLRGITVIEAGGKTLLPFFQKLMNAYGIPYLVLYDEDPVDSKLAGDKLFTAKHIFSYNMTIESHVDSTNKSLMIKGDFEELLGVSRSQAHKKGKALADYRTVEEKAVSDIPDYFLNSLKDFIEQ